MKPYYIQTLLIRANGHTRHRLLEFTGEASLIPGATGEFGLLDALPMGAAPGFHLTLPAR